MDAVGTRTDAPGETWEAESRARPAEGVTIWLPAVVAAISLLVHALLPNREVVHTAATYSRLLLGILVFLFIWTVGAFLLPGWKRGLRRQTPLVVVSMGLVLVYEVLALKLSILRLPYFPSPVKILEAFTISGDGKLLAVSVLSSVRLQAVGFLIGTSVGLPTGTLMGWNAKFRYWLNPVVRVIGPIPASALIPLAMVIFPSSYEASLFLLALATWFPVTIMTWSGVANVNKSYFDIARTLGASERYLVLKVALPAAMPLVFVGLFMGLGATFVTLIVAEMLGVKAGLGSYIQWAQGWGEYYKVYAGLAISAVLFSTLISLLFVVRDRVLVWQRGLLRW